MNSYILTITDTTRGSEFRAAFQQLLEKFKDVVEVQDEDDCSFNEGMEEAMEDIRLGRITGPMTAEEMIADLHSEHGLPD